ncbi:MAG TPA: hypothetical protein PKX56_01590 [Marmoricola sp.]|nr:hypothetical protein [Marmoricola sp.]HNJ78019.1 hypothetical protein [Marmoricola sp.]HNN48727.1 hypothetical protein [Marmoricola sp.]HNO40056.1 hypothetical protein [Marmoricola sp.]
MSESNENENTQPVAAVPQAAEPDPDSVGARPRLSRSQVRRLSQTPARRRHPG